MADDEAPTPTDTDPPRWGALGALAVGALAVPAVVVHAWLATPPDLLTTLLFVQVEAPGVALGLAAGALAARWRAPGPPRPGVAVGGAAVGLGWLLAMGRIADPTDPMPWILGTRAVAGVPLAAWAGWCATAWPRRHGGRAG